MGNPRPNKVAAVTEVKERFENASSVVVTEYRGMSVSAISELRRNMREAGGYYKVYKNTLVRRAAEEANLDLQEYLLGPTALAFIERKPDGSDGDVVTVAKTLRDFAKKDQALVIKGGYFDGSPIDAAGISELADVEPREVLLAKLAGAFQAPMQKFAGLMAALPRDFAYGLSALIDKGGSPGAPTGAPESANEAVPEADSEPEPATEEPTEAESPQGDEPAESKDTQVPSADSDESAEDK